MVGILIVFYNDKQHVQRLANNLAKQTFKDHKVFVLDNNPKLKHSEDFLNCFPKATVVEHSTNLGFAGGNNLLSKTAIATGCKYLLILNPDMELKNNALEKLHDFLECNNGYTAVGPTVFYGEDSKKEIIQLFGAKANFKTQKKDFLYNGLSKEQINLPAQLDVDLLNGGSLFVRSKYISDNYLFEEDYFLYNDELDFFKRLRDSGLKSSVISSAIVWHHHNWNENNNQGYNLMYYYMMRNKILYYHKFKLKWQLVLELIINIVLFPVIIGFCIRTSSAKMIYYYYLGLLHGVKNKTGEAKLSFI